MTSSTIPAQLGNPALVAFDNLLHLDGRVALVTGAGSGLGRAIAIRLSEAGALVVLAARRRDTLERTAEMFPANAKKPLIIPVDLLDAPAAEALPGIVVKQAERLDIVINNAGAGALNGLLDIDAEAWDTAQALNLRAPFLVSRGAASIFRNQGGGAIVNISSVAGVTGVHMAGAYAAAKAGLQMLTRVAAGEWGRYGIRVNAIAPGFVLTEASLKVIEDVGSEVFDAMAQDVPLRRNAIPEDIANLALFLVSDAASFISGQVIAVDGGPVLLGNID